ncbi:MAG: T9SS C-terminal target domain-containing protein [Candidatus Zixiibacteriota bacterium]|nr:MAG: T9SS C-terminal target domain-containing protein [candidate division Zixibacteria bacterium]
MKPPAHLLLPALLLMILPLPLTAQVPISGPLSGLLADTTYQILDSIYVDYDDSLTIEPGAVLLFPDSSKFRVYGDLFAVGTSRDSIYFLPDSGVTRWGSLIFQVGAGRESVLSYCRFSGACASAINCYQASITITHCTISDNQANWGGGIYCSQASSPLISACVVTGNQSFNNGGGIYSTGFGTDPVIVNCLIAGNASNQGGGGSGRGGGGLCANHQASPVVSGCVITGNHCNENGGGISINDNSHPQISQTLIWGNSADSSGGGVFVSYWCNASFSNCEIAGNQADGFGGGLCLVDSANVFLQRVEIWGDTAQTGGGLAVLASRPTLDRCTVAGNRSPAGGGLYISSSPLTLQHSVVAGHPEGDGVVFAASDSALISHCDFWGNLPAAFSGNPPEGLGILTAVNANGDSCDAFGNLAADPLFVSAGMPDHRLQWGSPCVDAGLPDSLDPDGTAADLGAFCFDQGAPVRLLLVRPGTPLQVPAAGGSFDYTIQVTNITAAAQTAAIWCDATLPDSSTVGPTLGPVTAQVPAGATLSRLRSQAVPAAAPPGPYVYHGHAAAGADTSHDSFPFVKLGGTDGDAGGGWANAGEPFPRAATAAKDGFTPADMRLAVHPNPFNPSTVARYELRDASYVSLRIYDTAGREIATLVDGWKEAGAHQVTFDGSDLASGVYVYRLAAGATVVSGKMVLVK